MKLAHHTTLIAATAVLGLLFSMPARAGFSIPTQTFLAGNMSTNLPESNLYLVYSGSGPTGSESGALLLPSAGPFDFAIPGITSAAVTVMGTYASPAGATGLSIGFEPGIAVSGASTYSDFFPGGPAESEVISALTSGDTASLVSLVANNATLFPQVAPDNSYLFPLWNFSDATFGGLVVLDVSSTPITPPGPPSIPEPSMAWLLAGSLTLLGIGMAAGAWRPGLDVTGTGSPWKR